MVMEIVKNGRIFKTIGRRSF